MSRIAHAGKASSGGERDCAGACQNLGRIVKKNFVNDAAAQGCPVNHSAAFDQDAGNFHIAEAVEQRGHIGTAIWPAWNTFYTDPMLLEFTNTLFFG